MPIHEIPSDQPSLDKWGGDLMLQINERLGRYRREVRRAGEKLVHTAVHQADVFEGKPVPRAPVTQAQIELASSLGYKTDQEVDNTVTRWPSVWRELVGLSRRDSIDEREYKAVERANRVTGSFVELRRPPWNSDYDGKDLLFVFDVDKPEVPNPSIKFVSVDPDSPVYGRTYLMCASDFGFRRNPYGGYVDYSRAAIREDMGYIPEDGDVSEVPGLGLLVKALAYGDTLPAPGLLEDVALFYNAHVRVFPVAK